ncbi:MAG: hypothetical protein COX06_03060 [Candidatus Zambryskibacteria bacterium CG22_combo_CG10-13_8_21_14_all_42_17]|uniref:BRCT domain-containing protein n=1 Tax=Candidatus Zambryskibacteria bacterium CG22_combo_CG10-13_8_21_14_all_42_17 TaxID=1975118 RepID=A0A2H0BCS1_9BACT|nr:MAG: hypothetical protein COX06_03060 [Candidatus Zambryskibacteria bacterium CG22_combo_CG10-13_8_21_14_all_42_17]
MAHSIIDWFADKENRKLFTRLLKYVRIKPVQSSALDESQKLTGKSFVLTGVLNKISREDAKERIRMLGGEIKESVSKNTAYVVAGMDPGEKLKRAQKLGVKIINETEFLKFIDIKQ